MDTQQCMVSLDVCWRTSANDKPISVGQIMVLLQLMHCIDRCVGDHAANMLSGEVHAEEVGDLKEVV